MNKRCEADQFWTPRSPTFVFGRVTTMALLVLSASGCATSRVPAFAEFAEAGTTYADATNAVLDVAAAAAVDADSAVLGAARDQLARARSGLSGDVLAAQREEDELMLTARLNEHNALLRKHVRLLQDLQAHVQNLREYFSTLSALAEAETAPALGKAARDSGRALGEVSSRVRDARIGPAEVNDLVRPIAAIAVARFQRETLDRELEARSGFIAAEIELQRAALDAIATELSADRQVVARATERSVIVEPFRNPSRALPKSWAKARREFLLGPTAEESVRAASQAADEFKTSFTALVEGRLDDGGLSGLAQSVRRVAELVK
ncbi:MAG: hypothetical protein ACR2RL_24740 [Gammaproteobacteria bacterium]